MKRNACLLIVFLLVSLSAFSQTQRISWADGKWEGEAYQPGYGTWSIYLVVDPSKKPMFKIEYPSLTCGGSLELDRVDQGTIWLKEALTHGQSFCVPDVRVALTRIDKNHISYSCFHQGSDQVTSWSTLQRVSK